MAKSINDLKKSAPAASNPAPDAAPAETKKSKKAAEKEAKAKMTPEQLQEMRLKNLKPKTKSPEKVERENAIKAHIQKALTEQPAGVTATALRERIFPDATPESVKALEKEIRFIARAMGCIRTAISGTRKVLYSLPK